MNWKSSPNIIWRRTHQGKRAFGRTLASGVPPAALRIDPTWRRKMANWIYGQVTGGGNKVNEHLQN